MNIVNHNKPGNEQPSFFIKSLYIYLRFLILPAKRYSLGIPVVTKWSEESFYLLAELPIQ